MSVSKTQDWATPSSSDPSGTVTFGGGTNRVFIYTQQAEFTGDVTASIAIGGVPATGVQRYFYDIPAAGDDLHIWLWYWNEADLQSMSGNTVSYSDDGLLIKRWSSYATFSSADQSDTFTFTSAEGTTVSQSNPLLVLTPGESGDFVVAPTACRATDAISWTTLSEKYDEVCASAGGARMGLADGAWSSSNASTWQSTASRTQIALAATIKQLGGSGGGIGSIIAPSAIVSGSADRYDGLIAATPQVAGVAERIIYWQGGVDLIAPKATSSTDATFNLFFNDPSPSQLECEFADLFGIGTRGSNGSGGVTAPTPITTSYSPEDFIGTGSCEAPVPRVRGSDAFDAFWYTSKTVYFLGA